MGSKKTANIKNSYSKRTQSSFQVALFLALLTRRQLFCSYQQHKTKVHVSSSPNLNNKLNSARLNGFHAFGFGNSHQPLSPVPSYRDLGMRRSRTESLISRQTPPSHCGIVNRHLTSMPTTTRTVFMM